MSKSTFRNIVLSFLLLLGINFSLFWATNAAAPNPGHNFTEISGGVAQGDLLYGSAADTLSALPKNATASRYLSNSGASNNPAWAQVDLSNGVTGTLADGNIASALTGKSYNALTLTAQGTGFTIAGGTTSKTLTLTGDATISGNPLANPMTTLGDIIYGGASGVATRLAGSAGFLKSTGAAAPTWSAVNLAASDVTGILPLANGGTAANLTASNGGICYSTAGALAILAGTATANKLLVSGASGAPSWSTPTFPNASATSGKMIKSDGTNWVASTETYAVPGASGNVMASDGTNWTSVVGGVLIARQTLLTGTTTYTPTAGTHAIEIEMWAGGGAGGSCTNVAGCASGGGGSGGYAQYFLTGVTGTYTVAIGAGGTAVAGAAGNTGGNTTFNTGATTITAFGGIGGQFKAGTAATKYTAGGAGGAISTNGHVNGAGNPGGWGSTSATATIGATGAGGSTSLGGGGVGVQYASAAAVVGVAAIANTGSGGSGGGTGVTTVAAGGAGAAGRIVIWEFR